MQNHFTKDYIQNKENCQTLADRIKAYWSDKGHDVDVWVETVPVYASNGDRLTTRYEIASDIKQRVPQVI